MGRKLSKESMHARAEPAVKETDSVHDDGMPLEAHYDGRKVVVFVQGAGKRNRREAVVSFSGDSIWITINSQHGSTTHRYQTDW